MPENSALISLTTTIITALVAAVIGFWLAKIRFKHDQLWQEKNSTYKRILSAVEAIRFWGDEMSSDTHFLPTVDWYDGKPAQQFYAEALREIHKQSVLGGTILSREFVDVLAKLVTEISKERFDASEERFGDPSYDEVAFGAHAAKVRDIADSYLPKLIELARQGLGV